MKKIKWLRIFIIFICVLILNGCNVENKNPDFKIPDIFSEGDYPIDWQSMEYESIDLSLGSTEINKSGIYLIEGVLENGNILVDVVEPGLVYLILNNAELNNRSYAPINIQNAEKVVIILKEKTMNSIRQGNEKAEKKSGETKAAIYSESDLTITGGGELKIITENNDAISCKADLKIIGGVLDINAVGDGIIGKDLLAVKDAEISIITGKDGLRSTDDSTPDKGNLIILSGNILISAGDDAIHSNSWIMIDGGTINISESYEALESVNILINDVVLNIISSDDGINISDINGTLYINGGEIKIESQGDAIDSNGNISQTGGSITINTDLVGNRDKAIDYDGIFVRTGGSIKDFNGKNIV